MKKILLSFLFLLMMCAGLTAGGISLSLSTGLLVPVTQFNADDTGWNENENFPGMMSDASYKVDMAFDYAFTPCFGLGLSTSYEQLDSPFTDDFMFNIPFYLDMTFTVNVKDRVSIPFTVSAGGYASFKGDSFSMGPAVRLSAAVDIRTTDWMTLFLKMQHELLFTVRDDFGTFDMTYYMVPVSAGIRFTF